MPTAISRYIQRSDSYTETVDVYARLGTYPQEEGDGIYAGSASFQPWQTQVVFTWTPPTDGTWKLIGVPVYRRGTGPFGKLN